MDYLSDATIKAILDGRLFLCGLVVGAFVGAFPGYAMKRCREMLSAWRGRKDGAK